MSSRNKTVSLKPRPKPPKPPAKPPVEPPIDVPPILLAYMPKLMEGVLDGSISLLVNQKDRLASRELNKLMKLLQDRGAQILTDKDLE